MDSGRKRIPLGAVSPSAVRNAQRRRSSNDVQTSFNVSSANRENLQPNRASASLPESSFQTPARNDNVHQQPSHSTLVSCTGNQILGGKTQGYLTPSQRRLLGVDLSGNSCCVESRRPNVSAQTHPHSKKPHNDGHPSRFSYSGISSGISNSRPNSLGISGRMNKNAQSYLTPSQRRLRNVDFTSPSQCFPSSRLFNRSTGGADHCMPFEMPASTIRMPVTSQPNGNKVKNTMCVNLLDRHTPAKTASQGSQQSDITVLVPELDRIGVRRPAWYSVESSNGPRNLLHAFNQVGEKSVSESEKSASEGKGTDVASTSGTNTKSGENNSTPPTFTNNAAEDETVTESEDSEEAVRGQYTAHDESDSISELPDFWKGYMDLGPPTKICSKCKAVMWNEERNNKGAKHSEPSFSICCRDGQVVLEPEKQPPPYLAGLLSGGDKTTHFLNNIRAYNSMFQFTSLGGKIDKKINCGKAPWCFKLNGQNYHLLGTLMPKEGETPKFCQLYIYDTENEVQNRINAVNGNDQLDPEIVEALLQMLDEHNKCARGFRMARDRFKLNDQEEFSLQLLHSRSASVPPAYYAHLAAFQARFYMEPETSDSESMKSDAAGGRGRG